MPHWVLRAGIIEQELKTIYTNNKISNTQFKKFGNYLLFFISNYPWEKLLWFLIELNSLKQDFLKNYILGITTLKVWVWEIFVDYLVFISDSF